MNNKNKKYDYPEAIVGVLVVNPEGKLLLAKSTKWSGKYTVFGGHVNFGESLADTAKRELKEETNIDAKKIKPVHFAESVFNEEFKHLNGERHFVFTDYVCEYAGDEKEIKLNDEFEPDSQRWFMPEEALKNNIAGGTRLLIENYLKMKEQEESVDRWKRCMADFENYKKRQAELNVENLKYANRAMIMDIIPVIDNFHASTDHIPEESEKSPWVIGIMYIQKQLEKVLSDNGVEEIPAKVGDKFNPEIHEAIHDNNQETRDKKQESKNLISKIVLKGYKLNGRVIRAARVIVE